MVRVAGIKGQVDSDVFIETIDGLLPEQVLSEVIKKSKIIKSEQNRCWAELNSELFKKDIKIKDQISLTNIEKKWVKKHFSEEIFPLLTPVAVDPAHPFPFVPNLGLCLVLKLKKIKTKETIKVVIPFPKGLKKFIKINNSNNFIRTEDLIILCINKLFPQYKILLN